MAEPSTICLVEDDLAIREAVSIALRAHGYEVITAADGTEGLRAAVRAGYDLLLLDLVLPGRSGLEILAEVKLTRPTLPVIILSALGDEADRVKGLKLGADDYMVKPYSMAELLARIEAVLRRSPERPQDVPELKFGGGTIDLERAEIRFADGSRADLSERESHLLRYLAGNRGRAVSREEILQRVWRLDPSSVTTRTIDMHVARLRDKLRDPELLITVRGKGYMYAARSAPPSKST